MSGRPTRRDAADAMHRRFAEPGSDFLAFLTLWDYLRDQQRQLSSSAFRRMCRREYLHYLRVREWQDVYSQLQQAARDLGILVGRDRGRRSPRAAQPPLPKQAPPRRERRPVRRRASRPDPPVAAGRSALAHRHAGRRPQARRPARRATATRPAPARAGPVEFAGARGARFAIFPDSPQARKPPPWVMAAELVETSRLWARTIARIEPEWAESLAGDLVRRSYSEPRWDARRGAVMAAEKVTLYGLPIVAARPGELRHHRSRRLPGTCSSSTPWSRATGRPTTRSSPATSAPGRKPRNSSTRPAAVAWSPTTRVGLRLLRRADTEDGHLGPALRLLVEAGPRTPIPACST